MKLDLGCWKNKPEGYVGVDKLGPPITDAEIIMNLGWDVFPLYDDSIEEVRAYNILEHIPFFVWGIDGTQYSPMVKLFNEVYRILEVNGKFAVRVPYAGKIGEKTAVDGVVFAGIEHCSYWTWNAVTMFSEDYYGAKDLYGHTSSFKLVSRNIVDGSYLDFVLQKG